MKRINEILTILRNAERVFRLVPIVKLSNHAGLCFYVKYQLRALNIPLTIRKQYMNIIFGDMYIGCFLFTNEMSQLDAWAKKIEGYNTERSDWLLEKIKELEVLNERK